MRQKVISKRSEPLSLTGAERARQCKDQWEGNQETAESNRINVPREAKVAPNVANPEWTMINE